MKVSLSNKLFLCAAVLAVGLLGDTEAHAQPGGVPLWTNHYNGPVNSSDFVHALAVDSAGNVFVTGYSTGPNWYYDYATIKYSNAGAALWTNRYNGPGNAHDYAYALAVDGSGNVFVTGDSWPYFTNRFGTDFATVAYSSVGAPMWTNRFNVGGYAIPSGVAVDDSGNVIVTGSALGDYATIKYSGAGVPLWTNCYTGPSAGIDEATAAAMDGIGNVFVTGHATYPSTDDYVTIKYSGDGAPLWTNRYNNGPGHYSAAVALAVDGGGNVFVTGYAAGDYGTIKYSGDGAALWTNRYLGVATALAVDGSGNVFVTGSSDYNYATIKYSGAGMPMWTNRYNGSGNGSDRAYDLAVDANGNVFVTGVSGDGGDFDYTTLAYSSAGASLWTNHYNGPRNEYDFPPAIAVDRSGNVFVTGTVGKLDSSDYVTIKYSSAGPLLTITRTTTNTLAVSWPSPAADFILQQNTNVPFTNWSAVSTPPADDSTNKTVIVDPPEGNRFYRLFRP